MITINLIPQGKKDVLKLAHIYVVIKNLIILVLVLTIIIAVILLATKAVLQNHFNNIVSQSTFTTKYANTFVKGIKDFNVKLSAAKEVQNEFIPWTDFLINFSELVPEDIVIYNVVINGNKVSIKGLAVTRDSLLQLEESLNQSNVFENVDIPLENLLKRENIEFNLKADLILDQIKKL